MEPDPAAGNGEMTSAGDFDPSGAKRVTSCPRACSPRASRSTISSIPPYPSGGTGIQGGATSAIRIRAQNRLLARNSEPASALGTPQECQSSAPLMSGQRGCQRNGYAGQERDAVVGAINFLFDDSKLVGGSNFSILGILGQFSWAVVTPRPSHCGGRASLGLVVGATLLAGLFASHAGYAAAGLGA